MTNLYLIDCRSNMHVGSGDSNYGVIDKQIQRDVTDKLPCIYASSLKGAFREFFEEKLKNKTLADTIFGEGENKSSRGVTKGSHIFDQAMLFSLPVRSNLRPFFNATAPMVAEKLLERIRLSNKQTTNQFVLALTELKNIEVSKGTPLAVNFEPENLQLEEYETVIKTDKQLSGLCNYLGQSFVIVSDADFIEITDDYHLPVIARNKLDNGESKNLWYEQVLPRETKLTFFVDYAIDNSFHANVNNSQLQIGGGSTIGYGYTKIMNIQL